MKKVTVCIDLDDAAVRKAAVGENVAMKLDNVTVAGTLVHAVDVLGDQGDAIGPPCLLQVDQRVVAGVRLDLQLDDR